MSNLFSHSKKPIVLLCARLNGEVGQSPWWSFA